MQDDECLATATELSANAARAHAPWQTPVVLALDADHTEFNVSGGGTDSYYYS